jgi:hypothetical protein
VRFGGEGVGEVAVLDAHPPENLGAQSDLRPIPAGGTSPRRFARSGGLAGVSSSAPNPLDGSGNPPTLRRSSMQSRLRIDAELVEEHMDVADGLEAEPFEDRA